MSKRIERVNELIREQLSILIQREFAETLGIIVVNSVEAERDLKSAKVYISGFSDDVQKNYIFKLQNHAHRFQQELAKLLVMKNIPKLTFIYDKYQKNIDKVQEILTQIEKEDKS